MSYTITKQYEGLPTDAAREAVAIMAGDRYTYAGDFAYCATTLRSVRAALQGFEGFFSKYVEDNGEMPIEWLLRTVQDELISVIDNNNGLTFAMQWVAFEDSIEVAKYAADCLHDFDVAIDAYEKAAAFILSIAGCSHEERLEKLAKLKQSEPFIGIEFEPYPEESDFGSEEAFAIACEWWWREAQEHGMETFLGDLLHELENIVSDTVEKSPLAPGHVSGSQDKDVSEVLAGIQWGNDLMVEIETGMLD